MASLLSDSSENEGEYVEIKKQKIRGVKTEEIHNPEGNHKPIAITELTNTPENKVVEVGEEEQLSFLSRRPTPTEHALTLQSNTIPENAQIPSSIIISGQ